ncbi:hypothetical protein ES705_48043 [subsurface metagenome]
MKDQSKTTLRHLAELISQNKNLEEENLKLQQQIETVTLELERYRNLVSKYKLEKKDQDLKKEKDTNVLKFKLATVLFADTQGFTKISEEMDSSQLGDSLDEIFLELGNIVSKYEIKNGVSTYNDEEFFKQKDGLGRWGETSHPYRISCCEHNGQA